MMSSFSLSLFYDRIIFKLESHLHCSNQYKNMTEKRMKLPSFCFGEIVYCLEMLCGCARDNFAVTFELDHTVLLAILIFNGLSNNLAFCTCFVMGVASNYVLVFV